MPERGKPFGQGTAEPAGRPRDHDLTLRPLFLDPVVSVAASVVAPYGRWDTYRHSMYLLS